MIPRNYFFYWSGPNFQYVHYLSIVSLLKTQKNIEEVSLYYENPPADNEHWKALEKVEGINIKKLNFRELLEDCGFNYENFQPLFKRWQVNHRSDLFRFAAIYCYGGVYLDMDTLMIKDFADLLNTQFFAGFHGPSNQIGCAVIGSVEEGDFARTCLESIEEFSQKLSTKEKMLGWGSIGPVMLGNLHKQGEEFTIYPREYFYYYPNKKWDTWIHIFKDYPVPNEAYLIHYYGYHSVNITKKMTREFILQDNSLYSKVAKKFI